MHGSRSIFLKKTRSMGELPAVLFKKPEKQHRQYDDMQRKQPLIIIAGADYGQGSSRDWAAKGVRLAGVEAIVADLRAQGVKV